MEYYLYLRAKPYLADFIRDAYGDPVELERNSPEARIIREFIGKTLAGRLPDTGEGANLKIRLPFFREADPRVYNYLGKKAQRFLLEAFEQLLEKCLISEIGPLDKNIRGKISFMIYAWMEKHGIADNETNWYTVSQKYYRLRKNYQKNRINL
jgi:hypothetical protein